MTYYPPVNINTNYFKIFLAGSIEMNKAKDWQKEITPMFEALNNEIAIFNPRRLDWNSDWKQDISEPNFVEQVNWELDHLDMADFIFMYFQPDTLSPITMMELGLYANTRKMIVQCPTGFWRKGNVDIICKRNNIPMVESFEQAVKFLKKTYEF